MRTENLIASLYDRLITTFENTSQISNSRLMSYGEEQLSRSIKIETGNFSTPFSDHQTKEIVLNERFLILTWCITYIIYEVTQNKSSTAIKLTETYSLLDKKDPEVQDLDHLFDWAFSLKHDDKTDWPTNLPNPTMKTFSVRVTNVIFIDAICYIMFHEVAHLVNGHWKNYQAIQKKLIIGEHLNSDEQMLCIQMEQEADSFAYDCLVSSQLDEEARYHKQLGIILTGLVSLFALKKGSKLTSITHPSSHVRIFNFLGQTAFSEDYEFQLNRVMNVGLSLFCKLQGITYEDKGFATFNALLDYFYNLLDKNQTEILIH
ncbi:hypothetical protein GCM10022289_20960 [Pedobacter jeongneungensis]|uniref:Peptidase U49-like protein n=1 Tax=Pedobacter jeongneungensis TaxID=947309 RepID=A0ABP8BD69_9SPHI